jgi:hypothetical protein
MKHLYNWIDYYFKGPEEKGHLKSMNIIWNKLNELKPTYWIHMEDDFVFIDKMNYVEKAIQGLVELKNHNVKQILFNINYGEIISNYNNRGHIYLENGFALHDHKDGEFNYLNCHYWPHYSFRPSLVDVSSILELGNFDTEVVFFEREYANKWFAQGYRSAFFDKITHIHIGRLTSERNDPSKLNAYLLNNENQFQKRITEVPEITEISEITEIPEVPDNLKYIIKIVNLEKRLDRKNNIINLFEKENITNYEFFKAIDGTILKPTLELKELFKGNDFGNRRGVIGCALSHYYLWLELLNDKENDYYIKGEKQNTTILCLKIKNYRGLYLFYKFIKVIKKNFNISNR